MKADILQYNIEKYMLRIAEFPWPLSDVLDFMNFLEIKSVLIG